MKKGGWLLLRGLYFWMCSCMGTRRVVRRLFHGVGLTQKRCGLTRLGPAEERNTGDYL